MKFKSPDGRMFNCIYSAKSHFCDQYSLFECEYLCQLNRKRNQKKMICYEFVTKYPIEAARLMGYEIIEDEQADTQEAALSAQQAENEKLQAELKEAEKKIDSLLDEEEKVAFYPFGVEKED